MKLVLDTNFLISVFELKEDFIGMAKSKFGNNNIITTSTVKEELSKILKSNDNRKKYAKLAHDYLSKGFIPVFEYKGDKKGDDAIIEFCFKNNYTLATQDKEMTKKAKKQHLKIIKIRQKSYLEELKS
ncbi:MAG: PIN domain-containing protein [Nanobdellota archaeon]